MGGIRTNEDFLLLYAHARKKIFLAVPTLLVSIFSAVCHTLGFWVSTDLIQPILIIDY
jgi:hypothetical protein